MSNQRRATVLGDVCVMPDRHAFDRETEQSGVAAFTIDEIAGYERALHEEETRADADRSKPSEEACGEEPATGRTQRDDTMARVGWGDRGTSPLSAASRQREGLAVSALDRLNAEAGELEPDELAVLCLVAERLKTGLAQYGALRVATDPRDFATEALEEAADGLVYAAVALMRHGRTPNPGQL